MCLKDIWELYDMSGNSILNSAKYSTDNTDEWYTTYETVDEELAHYEKQFAGIAR